MGKKDEGGDVHDVVGEGLCARDDEGGDVVAWVVVDVAALVELPITFVSELNRKDLFLLQILQTGLYEFFENQVLLQVFPNHIFGMVQCSHPPIALNDLILLNVGYHSIALRTSKHCH